jgi:hypothetical protein
VHQPVLMSCGATLPIHALPSSFSSQRLSQRFGLKKSTCGTMEQPPSPFIASSVAFSCCLSLRGCVCEPQVTMCVLWVFFLLRAFFCLDSLSFSATALFFAFLLLVRNSGQYTEKVRAVLSVVFLLFFWGSYGWPSRVCVPVCVRIAHEIASLCVCLQARSYLSNLLFPVFDIPTQSSSLLCFLFVCFFFFVLFCNFESCMCADNNSTKKNTKRLFFLCLT